MATLQGDSKAMHHLRRQVFYPRGVQYLWKMIWFLLLRLAI